MYEFKIIESVLPEEISKSGLVGPAHAWSQIAMQKEAKIYQKRPNHRSPGMRTVLI